MTYWHVRRTRFALGLISTTFLCHGQQVAIPQCPQFVGTPQVSASCITSVTDIAFDATGTGWIADNTFPRAPGRVLRFPAIKVGQVPSSNQTADLVLGKPNLSTLTNSSCQACSLTCRPDLLSTRMGLFGWRIRIASVSGPQCCIVFRLLSRVVRRPTWLCPLTLHPAE